MGRVLGFHLASTTSTRVDVGGPAAVNLSSRLIAC